MPSASLHRALAAAATLSAATAVSADPIPVFTQYEWETPTEYPNDAFENRQTFSAAFILIKTGSFEAYHRFFYSGSLQTDRVWGRSPSLGLQVLGKPIPARDPLGNTIPGSYYEPVRASAFGLPLLGVAPEINPLTYRLAIGSAADAFDGTVNGLLSNNPHLETGSGRVTIHFRDASGASLGEDSHDFRLRGGADAVRISFMAPPQTASADILVHNDIGVQDICYDVDFLELRTLEPSGEYRISALGGRTPSGAPTPLQLGLFSATGQLLLPFTDAAEFTATSSGRLYIGVTGAGDGNFNGLVDAVEDEYFDFLNLLNQSEVNGHPFAHTAGASVMDTTVSLVNRYPRTIWDGWIPNPGLPTQLGYLVDGQAPESLFQHGVCGDYVLLIEYIGPTDSNSCPADLTGDSFVGSEDLATMLGAWGPCP